jgi:hypothetical protein
VGRSRRAGGGGAARDACPARVVAGGTAGARRRGRAVRPPRGAA